MIKGNSRQLETCRCDTVIPSGGNLSGTIQLGGLHLCGLILPAAWDAAPVTLQASANGNDFHDVHTADGTELSITVGANRWVVIDLANTVGFANLRLRSGASASPVNQTAERLITVISRSI